MFGAIIVQIVLVTISVINSFEIHYCFLLYRIPELSSQSGACSVDVNALNFMNGVQMSSIMITTSHRQNRTAGKLQDLLNVIQANSSYSHSMDFGDSSFMELIKRQNQNLNDVNSEVCSYCNFPLSWFICLSSKGCRTATVTKISGF